MIQGCFQLTFTCQCFDLDQAFESTQAHSDTHHRPIGRTNIKKIFTLYCIFVESSGIRYNKRCLCRLMRGTENPNSRSLACPPMHDAEIASRQEAVMKGRWKRLIQAKPERENKRDGRGIEGKKTTKSKKNPLSREYGICTSFSSYSAVMSCWHMCDLAVFGEP
jgi:hypothetical protein